jgi:hypothetical protein
MSSVFWENYLLLMLNWAKIEGLSCVFVQQMTKLRQKKQKNIREIISYLSYVFPAFVICFL